MLNLLSCSLWDELVTTTSSPSISDNDFGFGVPRRYSSC